MNLGKESEVLEFKESTSELHSAIESIASILNKHDYGEIYFGVYDNGEPKGQIVTDSTIKKISDSILRDIEPRIIPTITEISIEGKSIIKVSFSGKNKPYSAFGKFLVRVGTQNRHMTREELKKLFLDSDYSYP
ncbi:Divergent AAA domain [Chlamydia trachomatis]|nr:Divergent AAA domain [Chlamydia trachomatis]